MIIFVKFGIAKNESLTYQTSQNSTSDGSFFECTESLNEKQDFIKDTEHSAYRKDWNKNCGVYHLGLM